MHGRQFFSRVFIVAISILGLWALQSAVTSAATYPTADDDGMEVLTRGPIHEAFADVSVNEATPAEVISRSVPEPITEIPPDYRPEGDNVQWISGYWSWDDEQNDFVWISGIWRDVPPGRQWVPGYWMAVEEGSRFVSGYWTDTEQTETVYLPPPPQPLQAVPATTISPPDTLWIDGHWLWSGNGYVWQSGYWLEQRPGRIWIPAHYVWTPRGSVFVRGYWDYQFDRRGVLFAPRYYPRPSYRSHDYYYTPSIVLNIDSIVLSLFIRRNHHHYYFGDYHDRRYERRGFLPWYSRHATSYGYDPCYRGYRWHRLRENKHWEHNYHQQYQFRRDHRKTRPPVLYRSQASHKSGRSLGPQDRMLGRPLAEVVEKRDQPVRFTRLNSDHKRDYQKRERRLAAFQAERRGVEMAQDKERSPRKGADIKRPERVRLSASPIVDRSGRKNFTGKRQAGYQERRRPTPRQQTMSGPKDNQQALSQPVRPTYTRKSNDQAQAGQLRNGLRKVEEKRHIRPQTKESARSSRRAVAQPGSRSQFHRQISQQKNQPGKVENRRFVQPRVTEQRRQYRRVETKAMHKPRIDQQRSRSTNSTVQKSGSPRIKQFTGQPRKHGDRLRKQPQAFDQKGKWQNRSRDQRRTNNR